MQYKVRTLGPDGYRERKRTAHGPFYHGGRARKRRGGLLTAGQRPNSWGDTFDERGRSVFVYFSADLDVAAEYARQTCGRIYEVEPIGAVEIDGSEGFRTRQPLRVIRVIPEGEIS